MREVREPAESAESAAPRVTGESAEVFFEVRSANINRDRQLRQSRTRRTA
jgi:hypothetical protein